MQATVKGLVIFAVTQILVMCELLKDSLKTAGTWSVSLQLTAKSHLLNSFQETFCNLILRFLII